MSRRFGTLALAVVAGLSGWGCSSTTPSAPASVAISGVTGTLTVGDSAQLLATATLPDGTKSILTSEATWQSANPAIATVSAAGVVTAVGVGTTDIRATSQGVTGSAQMVVPSVTSVAISGVRNPMAIGDTEQLHATALLSNNLQKDVTARAAWAPGDATVFSLSSAGLLSAVGKGLTNVRATYQGAVALANAVVDQPGCTYLVSPATLTIDASIRTESSTVTTQPGCAWTVSSDADWLTVALPLPGSTIVGSKSFFFKPSNFEGATLIFPRVGHVMVRWDTPTAGQNVLVTQTGACSAGLDPNGTSHNFGADGGNGHLRLILDVAPFSGNSTDGWQFNSTVDWITVTSPKPGIWYVGGDGVLLSFSVSPNPGSAPRVGSLVACNATFTVTQAGR